MNTRKSSKARANNAYPSDVSDEEWSLVAPYLTLMTEDAPQREYPLRAVFNALRWISVGVFQQIVDDLWALLRFVEGRSEPPTAAIFDSHTLQSTPESGDSAGYDGARRRKGSKVHIDAWVAAGAACEPG